MTKLYLVTQPAIPEQQFLVETLEPYYLLSFAENWDGLLQQLKDDEHLPGVVIFSETAQKLPLQVTQLKTVHRGIG
nr:hypothetical protein [Vampirovibrio sp.]